MIRQLKRAFLFLAGIFTVGLVFASGSSPYATGGDDIYTIIDGGKTYYVHKFTSVGSAAAFKNTSGKTLNIEYLVVGGGGAGGDGHSTSSSYGGGGGGGGGGVFEGSADIEDGVEWTITVGNGGNVYSDSSHIAYNVQRDNAGASSIYQGGSEIARAGKGGAGGSTSGNASVKPCYGAAGGGDAGYAYSTRHSGSDPYDYGEGTFTSHINGANYGPFWGGSDYGITDYTLIACGGGGAGGTGGRGSETQAGNGGSGLTSTITGTPVVYGGGGGGGSGKGNSTDSVSGGLGGGAGGAGANGDTAAEDGAANTGSGGGGGSKLHNNSGNGGSGIVVIRYSVDEPVTPSGDPLAEGGDYVHKENIGGTDYWIHEFSNGTARAFTNTSGAPLAVEYLVVGGGGAGGNGASGSQGCGGGGGGGVVRASDNMAANVSWTVTVGSGGVAGGAAAGASSIDNGGQNVVSAPGGGAGAGYTTPATSGAAGGGGCLNASSGKYDGASGNFNSIYPGASYDKYSGGSLPHTNFGFACGGGGAAGAGGNGTSSPLQAGNGGLGIFSDFNGGETAIYYGAGGGGGAGAKGGRCQPGEGANGGGRGGSGHYSETPVPAQSGISGTGCGGGGASLNSANAGNGGSGIVIIRYAASVVPAQTYTATFMNGDKTVDTQTGVTEATEPSPEPTEEGFGFIGWKVNGEGDIVEFPYTLKGDTTFKACFVPKFTVTIATVENCTITVFAGQDPVSSGAELNEGTVLTVRRVPASGYALSECAPEEQITLNDNLTLTAAVTPKTTWTVTFRYDTNTEETFAYDGESPQRIPDFRGGSWEIDPTHAIISCDTNFVYVASTFDNESSPLAQGGKVSTFDIGDTRYYVHTFSDTTDAREFRNTSGKTLNVEYLVVGGGGAGGDGWRTKNATSGEWTDYGAGGGGGGGGVQGGFKEMTDAFWTITVGKGGTGGAKQQSERTAATASEIRDGSSSVLVSVPGGGAGGCVGGGFVAQGGAAGGGGASRNGGGTNVSGAAGEFDSRTNSVYLGKHRGGNGSTAGVYGGGGGGGAAGDGSDCNKETGGAGGAGITSEITGSAVTYGAGGAGGSSNNNKDGASGAAGTGCGGGGSGMLDKDDTKSHAGNGGDGVVIIRYSEPIVKFTVTFSSNTTANVIHDYDVSVVSNGHVSASSVPPWTGTWDVKPSGATIVCNTNFNCVVKEAVITAMPFATLGTDVASRISWEGSYEPDTGTHSDGKAYVAANTTARLSAIDVTGKTYCGCWRDDATGELFWGETVEVTPTVATTYTACFGPMWQIYKDELYDRVTANKYYHLNNGIWDFKSELDEITGEIKICKLLEYTNAAEGIVNFTTPIMDANGNTNGYKITLFSNWDDNTQGYAQIFENSAARPHYKLLKLLLLPETTEEVDVMAFSHLEEMTGILCIPKNVRLQHQAFAYSSKLEGLIFKGGVDGGQTFEAKTYILKGEPHYSEGNQFETSPKIAGKIVLPKSITYIPPNCFHTDKSIQEIDLTYVTNVSNRGLYDCHSLTNAIGLEALKSVTFMGCCGCWNLKGDVTFTNLESGCFCAFANCGFTSVKLPAATEFHYGVFANNSSLTNIVFSTNVVKFVCNVGDDHPQWAYSTVKGAYSTNSTPCWLEFPGYAPVFTNLAKRATCSIIFGEQDAQGSGHLGEPKELCLQGDWDFDLEGWQKIYDEIGDPMPYNSARPKQDVPESLDVRGTMNWMYKFDFSKFTGTDDEKEKAAYENLEDNVTKAFLISRPKGLYFFVK